MHASSLLLPLLWAASASAIPTPSSPYTQLLSSRAGGANPLVAALGQNCDLSNVPIPTAPTPLPAPAGKLAHVLIGRGTQNYTCDLGNSTAVPVLAGAVATLFNASCLMASASGLSTVLTSAMYGMRTKTLPTLTDDPVFARHFDSAADPADQTIFGQQAEAFVAGHHYFIDVDGTATPHFDLDTPNGHAGAVTVGKAGASDPPAGAQAGSVSWLLLAAPAAGAPQAYSQVYRVETMGGDPPATCKEAGQKSFHVKYAAQYWFYQ